MLPVALFFAILLIAYDALTAVVARFVGVSYDSFLVLLWVIVFFMGVLAGRSLGAWKGIIAIVLAAVAEATIGWYIAAFIGPGYVPGWTTRTLVALGVERVALSIAVGIVGVWIGLRVAGLRRGFF